MKNCIIYILIIICFFGCLPKKKDVTKNDEHVNTKVIEKKIPIFQVDSSMNKILTEIIKTELGCPYYINGRSCFLFGAKKFVNYYEIYIGVSYVDDIDFSYCLGIFDFKGYKFIYGGDSCEELLHKSNYDSLSVKYTIDTDNSIPMVDDSYSQWSYQYKNKSFKDIGHTICYGHKSDL